VLEIIMADRAYYQESGGGVTLSGGEPVLQHIFAGEILAACKKEGLHTAVQTAGAYPYFMLESLLPHLDMIMYDIKGYAPRIYRDFIRGGRDAIFGNLIRVSREFPGTLSVRTPVICPVNDTEEEIGRIAQMLSELPRLDYYQLLPYHGLGKAKYDALGIEFNQNLYPPSPERMEELERMASRFVPVYNQDRGMLNPGG
jgi:pyruvate formate lyase activating enzyme